jgi:hypothetical protein
MQSIAAQSCSCRVVNYDEPLAYDKAPVLLLVLEPGFTYLISSSRISERG